MCIHGTQDKYVAHEQAFWLVDRLKAAGVEADLNLCNLRNLWIG
jgi:dipeptidyl aminopeptidase/acylaminoacyl peptidase